MNKDLKTELKQDLAEPRTFLMMLIAGEVLARRDEVGPLARPYAQRMKRQTRHPARVQEKGR